MIQRYEKQAFSGFTTKNCSLILKNKGDDSMRILVAEDEKDLNRIIVERLEQEHYSVDACFDGEEALDYMACAKYDAVILDIMMPRLDGLGVLRKMRSGKRSDADTSSDSQRKHRRPGDRTGCRSQ